MYIIVIKTMNKNNTKNIFYIKKNSMTDSNSNNNRNNKNSNFGFD